MGYGTHTHVKDMPLIYHMWRHAETISSGFSVATPRLSYSSASAKKVCMQVRMQCMYMCVCMHVRMVRTHVHTHVRMHMYIYIYIRKYVMKINICPHVCIVGERGSTSVPTSHM